jgi:hypothetical protein
VGKVRKPLGGVHREVTEGNRSERGGHRRASVESWGVVPDPPFNLPNAWKAQIEKPETLDEIRNRSVRRRYERIVSRKLNGKWVVGASNLSRREVDEFMENDGYEWIDQELFDEGRVPYLVEYYERLA